MLCQEHARALEAYATSMLLEVCLHEKGVNTEVFEHTVEIWACVRVSP